MRVIRDLAMLEPLVDTVQPEAVLTDHCVLWECDIQTVKKSDLTFECPFRVQARRSDFIHVRFAAQPPSAPPLCAARTNLTHPPTLPTRTPAGPRGVL